MLHAVIMAGGSGTRFWPQSRKSLPKQLLRLVGERTLIQSAVDRIVSTPPPLTKGEPEGVPPERIWIVTNAAQAGETRRQLPELPADNLLVEPCGRNTAPCIGLAAIELLARDPDAVMLVMPADHVIRPDDVFRAAVRQAAQIVARDPAAFVLFGVPPTEPATGFGYIERGSPLDVRGGYQVQAFKEKPTREVAQQYVAAGTYYWNCGIFVWRADSILQSLARHEPEIHARLQSLAGQIGSPGWTAALAAEFPRMKSISIDYAVLERSSHVTVLEAQFEWDDVGSWQALPRLLGQDADGNTVDGLHVGFDTRGCIIRSDPAHLVATIGLEDFIVVHTPEATLVAKKDDENALRRLVAELEQRGLGKFL